MGSSISHADATQPPSDGLAVALPTAQPPAIGPASLPRKQKKVDWLNLPCPVPVEGIQRKTLIMLLNAEFFERSLNPLAAEGSSHCRDLIGSLKLPSGSPNIIEILTVENSCMIQFQLTNTAFYNTNCIPCRLRAKLDCDGVRFTSSGEVDHLKKFRAFVVGLLAIWTLVKFMRR